MVMCSQALVVPAAEPTRQLELPDINQNQQSYVGSELESRDSVPNEQRGVGVVVATESNASGLPQQHPANVLTVQTERNSILHGGSRSNGSSGASSPSSGSTELLRYDTDTPRSHNQSTIPGSRSSLLQMPSPAGNDVDDLVSETMSHSSYSSVISSTQTCDKDLIDVDLRTILSKHALGQALIPMKELDGATRDLLVSVIADHMIVTYQRPSKRHYLSYSHAVRKMFKMENIATYYVPSFHQKPPKGKLYCKVTNILARRSKLGLKTPGSKSGDKDASNVLAEWNEDADEGNDDMVAWLNVHNRPRSKMLEYWRKTAKRRLNFIHGDNMPDINTVCKSWPRYNDKEGFLLIGEDFSRLYTGREDKLSSVWSQVYAKVIEKVQKLKQKDKVLERLIMAMKEDCFRESSQEVKMMAAMYFLPLLLPEACVAVTNKIGSRKRCSWKPTIIETMAHFIDVQKHGIDLEKYLEEKASCLQRFNMNVQPHVIVLSSQDVPLFNDSSLVSFAVVSGKLWYRTSSLLEAVDVCLKSAFVFGVKFAPAAQSSWLFIQKAIFGIATKFDSAPTKVLELMSELGIDK